MKFLLIIFLISFLFVPTTGQFPAIGIIDFYGLRTITVKQARTALQINEGDASPLNRAAQKEAQSRLEALPNVEQARLNFVCCEAGKVILYIGIRERGYPELRFRPAPGGATRLPERMVKAGDEFQSALAEGLQKGDVGEDDSQGHALFSCSAFQNYVPSRTGSFVSPLRICRGFALFSATPLTRRIAPWRHKSSPTLRTSERS